MVGWCMLVSIYTYKTMFQEIKCFYEKKDMTVHSRIQTLNLNMKGNCLNHLMQSIADFKGFRTACFPSMTSFQASLEGGDNVH